MCHFSAPLVTLYLISAACSCDAFVSPIARSAKCAHIAESYASHSPINSLQQQLLGGRRSMGYQTIGVQLSRRRTTCLASKEVDETEEEDGAASKGANIDEPPSAFASADIEEKEEPSKAAMVSFNIFKLFSYCIQFLGAFFFCGFILNLLGFGYTVSLERGLVVDKIQNIRNEVQFEREIEREERAELKGSATSKYIIAPNVPEINAVSIGDP